MGGGGVGRMKGLNKKGRATKIQKSTSGGDYYDYYLKLESKPLKITTKAVYKVSSNKE